MKIGLVGKGGSGKTTISALLSRYLAAQNFPVLAIDADINQHLGRTLGMSKLEAETIPHMGIEIDKIKEYVRGENILIKSNEAVAKTTPPGPGSRLLKIKEENPIFNHFVRNIEGVQLLAVGPFNEEDLGIKCYHSKTGSVELLLNHLIDMEKEYVIVDMTAGADSFASGMFTRFDITFLVVEPTIKSVSVYEQYKKYARDYDVTIKVIGNKIESEEDILFLKKHIGNDLVVTLQNSQFVKKTDRGENLPISTIESENERALQKIVSVIDHQKKDWQKFYRQAVEFHIKNARSWANEAAGEDLTKQVAGEFDLESAINAIGTKHI